MKFEIFSSAPLDPSNEKVILTTASILFGKFCDAMKIDAASIDKVILSDESSYGEAIRSIDENEKFTKRDSALGVGKTIPIFTDDGAVTNSIIVRLEHFIAYLGGINQRENGVTNSFQKHIDQTHYIFAHELGHCKDHNLRKNRPLVSEEQLKKHFKIESFKNYQCYMLEGEFAASAHSAFAISPDFFKDQQAFFNGEIRKFINDLRPMKNGYDDTPEYISKIAYNATSVFWYSLIEHSKLVGSLLLNPNLSKEPISLWDDISPKSESVMREFHQWLSEKWNLYPSWGDSFRDEACDFWFRLALAEGYKFVPGSEQGDGLYFKVDKSQNTSTEEVSSN